MKTKQVLGIIVTALIIFSLAGVYAQEEGIATGEFSLLAWFQHTFGIEPFTVVGDTRSCGTPGGNWNYAWSVAAGKHLSGVDGILSGTVGSCPNNAGLYNIYTNGGTRYVETKSLLNPVNWVCGTGPCIIQLYCCPQPEPTQPGNCVFPRVFRTIDCSDNPFVRGSRTFYWCESPSGELEGNMPYFYNHYNYCTVMATRYCWYRNGNYCSNRLYDRTVFPDECEEYTYDDRLLYTDPDDCESGLGSCVVDLECTSNRHCSGGTCVLDSPPTCTSFTYSGWSSCVNGWRTRTITSSQPNGCTGGNPQPLGRTCDSGGLCGNGIVNSGEQCDGSNLNGRTCQTQGFDSGTLSCTSSCTFNTAQCSVDAWVNSPSECVGSKPIGCADKRCVAISTDCGTCQWTCPSEGLTSCIDGKINICSKQDSNCGSWVPSTTSCTGDATFNPDGTPYIPPGEELLDDNGELKKQIRVSLTEDAFNDATPELLFAAMCRLGNECSKTEILNLEEGFESGNYSVTCKTSTSIKETNKQATELYLKEQLADSQDLLDKIENWLNLKRYQAICEDQTIRTRIINTLFGLYNCEDTLSDAPTGTCRATLKTSSFAFCYEPINNYLSKYTNTNNCQTNTITAVIILLVSLLIISKLIGKK